MRRENSNQNEDRNAKQEPTRSCGCPCGKFYLSYPALFTHVKQKHDGKVNVGQYRPQVL